MQFPMHLYKFNAAASDTRVNERKNNHTHIYTFAQSPNVSKNDSVVTKNVPRQMHQTYSKFDG